MTVTVFNVDIPFRDRCKDVLGEAMEVFPVTKHEDVSLPCVQIVRESADVIPNSGKEPHYSCTVHLMCYSTDYDEGVSMVARLMDAFNGVTLRYIDDDGSSLMVKCLKVGAGAEGADENSFYQEIVADCHITVLS